VRAHLFDYSPHGVRVWLALAATGALAQVWAASQLAALPWPEALQVALGLCLVAAAACFPVSLPRTRYHVSVADVFLFALLALHGAPAAALGAAVEGAVGACRSSKRLTSRVSTPAAAGAGMAAAGLLFEALDRLLVGIGWSAPAAAVAALCAAALPYFSLSTLPLLAVVAAKNNQQVSLRDWAGGYAWLAAVYMASALLAGLLVMNARQFGPEVLVAAVLSTGAALALLQVTLRRHEADRAAQEARIAAAQREAQHNQQRFTAAFSHAAVGMAIVRPDGRIQQVNQALCRLLGQSAEQLQQQVFDDLLHPGDAALFRRRTEALAAAGEAAFNEAFSMELRCRGAGAQAGEAAPTGDDGGRWVSLHRSHFADPADARPALIYQLHDITSRRLAEDRLHHTAYHDSLTDLANRSCFNERLAVAVEASATTPAQGFAVLFLDMDRFKVVNDSLGHAAGNVLLCEVARRLRNGVRPGDLVARLGGDEFAVLAEGLQGSDAALALAQSLLLALQQPLMIHGTELVPGASIGITLSDLGYRTADEILRDADLAMYAAKAGGRQRVALFDHSMHERMAEKLKLEGELRRAIGEGQLSVMYQPLYDLEPYRISGFEALARWVHPERGPISPAVFIALAEESGHIEALTQWVIDQAVGQLATWRRAHPALGAMDMHVNISGRDLANPGLTAAVQATLQRHGLPAPDLTLEITETTLMGKLETALGTLDALRRLGVRFSIDDFGTGYSSLAYLSILPIDSLKIDGSFVRGMRQAPQNVEIVRAVLNLGLSLGKKVIAEGIETLEQLTTLKGLGVHVGQGYLLSRPLRADQVPALLGEPLPPELAAAPSIAGAPTQVRALLQQVP
jgi:diguanylate cyclase (GGDEF)-like protein/PAS domain S-box-containing protein